MAKYIRCKDVGEECDFEARAETLNELLSQCSEHARSAHGIAEIPQELREKVIGAVRDVS